MDTNPENDTQTQWETEPKKIVLGVVDAINIPCTSSPRKKRWDQGPEKTPQPDMNLPSSKVSPVAHRIAALIPYEVGSDSDSQDSDKNVDKLSTDKEFNKETFKKPNYSMESNDQEISKKSHDTVDKESSEKLNPCVNYDGQNSVKSEEIAACVGELKYKSDSDVLTEKLPELADNKPEEYQISYQEEINKGTNISEINPNLNSDVSAELIPTQDYIDGTSDTVNTTSNYADNNTTKEEVEKGASSTKDFFYGGVGEPMETDSLSEYVSVDEIQTQSVQVVEAKLTKEARSYKDDEHKTYPIESQTDMNKQKEVEIGGTSDCQELKNNTGSNTVLKVPETVEKTEDTVIYSPKLDPPNDSPPQNKGNLATKSLEIKTTTLNEDISGLLSNEYVNKPKLTDDYCGKQLPEPIKLERLQKYTSYECGDNANLSIGQTVVRTEGLFREEEGANPFKNDILTATRSNEAVSKLHDFEKIQSNDATPSERTVEDVSYAPHETEKGDLKRELCCRDIVMMDISEGDSHSMNIDHTDNACQNQIDLVVGSTLDSGGANQVSFPGLLTMSKYHKSTEEKPPIKEENKAEPRLEPITLRIFKDNLSIRTDLESLKKQKTSPASPKQLEFTLKIAKDASSNLPKATMSPKSSPSSPRNKITLKLSKDGGHPEIVEEELEKKRKVEEPDSILKEALMSIPENPPPPVVLPAPKKRGRPRKIPVIPKPEPEHDEVAMEGSFDADLSRPVRSCRGRTRPIVVRTRRGRGGRGGGRGGRTAFRDSAADLEALSEYEKAELAKIEAKKEKLKQDRLAKIAAKKAKALAKKLKDEERRKRQAREKAEALAQAALQAFEEETRMSATGDGMQGRVNLSGLDPEESQSSFGGGHNKKGRMEIPLDFDCHKEVKVEHLAEYQWQGSELHMIQEQISLYLGVKSFKRKYPDLKRRPVEAEERTFLEESGLVPRSMCDLGLTAVSSAEVLDIMFHDFPDKYEEFRKHVREKQMKEATSKQRAFMASNFKSNMKMDTREHAMESAAVWNANLNKERNEERKCSLDLQTFCIHYPKARHSGMTKPAPKVGSYPVALIPGQFCDYFKPYSSAELRYFPVNTVLYGPVKPSEKTEAEEDSVSDSEESCSSSSSSSSSSDSETDDNDPKCKLCSGTRKKNKGGHPELMVQCGVCSGSVHPTCQELTLEMVPHIQKYKWQCTDCKTCIECKDPSNDDKMLFCDLCDRGYHIYCVGLHKVPDGRWHCTECSFCANCGVRDPGGPDWQHEWQHMFKKGEKGARTYQLTLCVACSKLWRKGNYCQICLKCYSMKPEEETDLQQCNTCDRYLHKECYTSKVIITSKVQSNGFQCDACLERVQTAINATVNIKPPMLKV